MSSVINPHSIRNVRSVSAFKKSEVELIIKIVCSPRCERTTRGWLRQDEQRAFSGADSQTRQGFLVVSRTKDKRISKQMG